MNPTELAKRIEELKPEGLSYGTSAEAAIDITYDTFMLAAKKLGLTGFQAGCCAMELLAKINCIEGPFIYLKAQDLCYPQYNLHQKLEDFIQESQPWVKEQCQKNLSEIKYVTYIHPDVIKHWKEKAQ